MFDSKCRPVKPEQIVNGYQATDDDGHIGIGETKEEAIRHLAIAQWACDKTGKIPYPKA